MVGASGVDSLVPVPTGTTPHTGGAISEELWLKTSPRSCERTRTRGIVHVKWVNWGV